ncbi:MAG: nitrate reductase subunit alpha [Anaerolineae bacterium]|nr:nitrate reductase subunit alpha [Anaerolineae bacterium]
MGWVKELVSPQARRWEELYRNRWQHDKVVRSTHGVNCTGGCSWNVYVKDGIVTWEMQATDYPLLDATLPPYEPRGCQRGISFSWYIYSPIRVKYPYGRGILIDLWRAARAQHADPVAAWESIMADPEQRRQYQQARGKGGLRRISWDEALEIITASTLHTIKQYGPDRVIGFSPIPAMSMLSYASGSRFLQLLGGTVLSFYDWYCDLPPASPEVWGEQTDVAESADWYNSKYIVAMGSNVAMTRTPDAHFLSEARSDGSKLVVLSPDFSQTSKHADWWVPVNAGQDGAFWMAANHVILKEFHADRPTPYFMDYVKRYTDSPFLVVLEPDGDAYRPGRMLRASQLAQYQDEENAETKYLVFDTASKAIRLPQGTIGFRWQKQKGQWNLDLKDGHDGLEIDPALTLLADHDAVLPVAFQEFAFDRTFTRGVPVRTVETTAGPLHVATIYDLLMAQFGVGRGLEGDYPADYDDEDSPYTPAWQERFTGIDRQTVIRFAREWSVTAEQTQGQCSIIIGAGVNHWYHNNLLYRAAISGLMLTGCVGRNGGGLNHYVGQEKLAPMSVWLPVAMALDWIKPPRLQNAPSFHYVHSDQWRYEGNFSALAPVGDAGHPLTQGHTMDLQRQAVRSGWLPFYPQFNRNSLELAREAEAAGVTTPEAIKEWIVEQLRSGALRFSVDDPDAPENWPRTWFIWRGNALQASAKGHEYFLKHYLGTHTNAIAEDVSGEEPAPEGKLDLVVDINFRMDTSALYSDIVLPTATWYEKDDLNSTDLHSYIHPLQEVVPPCWESRSDWDIFKAIAGKVSELAAEHFPAPLRDIVAVPLQHDTPAEIAQPDVRDWAAGECDPVPGKTMPDFVVVERDYTNLRNRFISLGPGVRDGGIGVHGIQWSVADLYDELAEDRPAVRWNGARYPSLEDAKEAANAILHLAPETNGESAYRAFKAEEAKVGLPLADLAEKTRGVRYTFEDLGRQPRRLLTSPAWSGIVNDGRAYSAYCLNVERLVPWRTLTGRQHFYLDHEGYIAFGEHLPTYKPKIDPHAHGDILRTKAVEGSIMLNYLTPHGKWQIHSTYSDNLRMRTLSRGVEPFWMNVEDAAAVGIEDNDWVEIFNDHGVMVTRAIVTARIPRGLCFVYHATERTLSVPRSPLRGDRRAGGHNSLTRTRLKPNLMLGGYGQFTYAFNYWGPTGVNRDTFVLVRKLDGEPRW